MRGLRKPSNIKFKDLKIEAAYHELKASKIKEELKFYKWITEAIEDIEENAFCGI